MKFKHAIIVGASSGIGRDLVRQLVASGCAVAAVARRIELLDELRTSLQHEQRHLLRVYQHDVTALDSIPELFQRITFELGGLDLVVYCAGQLSRITEDEFDTQKDVQMISVNVIGAMAWLNQAALRFQQIHSGTIVGVSSIAGDRGRRGNPAYCSSKAALNTYLESLRNRLSRFGIHVVTVRPGFVDTIQTQGLKGLLWLISSDRAAQLILKAAERNKNTAYIPARWRLIAWIIKCIPSVVFRRLSI